MPDAPAGAARIFPASSWRWTGRRVAVAALLVAAAVPLLLLRQAGVPAWDTMWAEDGGRFLQLALDAPTWAALTTTYAGYLHAVPRLVAEVATVLPLSWAADLFAVANAAAGALAGLVVFVAAAGHVRSVSVRAVLAASVPLLPIAGDEVAHAIANIQWWLLFPTFWVLLWRPQRSWGVAGASAWLAATALSAPLAVLYVPLAAVRLVLLRGRQRLPAVVFLAAVAAQLVVAATSGDVATSGPVAVDVGTAVRLYGQRIAGAALAGHVGSWWLWARFGDTWVWAAIAAVGALTVGAAAGGAAAARRWLVPACVAHSVAFFAVAVSLRDIAPFMVWTQRLDPSAGRYTVAPVLFLYAALAAALDTRPAWARRGAWTGVRVVVLAVLVAQIVVGFRWDNARSVGPSWDAELADARRRCLASGVEAVRVDISPIPSWAVRVPCTRLTDR